MRKTIFNNKENGITLIALVITVIVLLMLAGIAISMLSGENGILNQATKAKLETEKKSLEEQVNLAVLTALTVGNSDIKSDEGLNTLNKELSKLGYNQQITEEDLPLEDIIINGEHFTITEKGEVKHLAWWYKKDAEGKITDQITNGTQTLTLCDEIKYNPYSNGKQEYKSLASKNGNSDQIFTISNNDEEGQLLTWKVLGIDDNGNIVIMPTDPIKTENGATQYFKLGTGNNIEEGQLAAQYGVDEINKIAEIYGHGKGALSARSIKEEDIANIVNPISNNERKVTYEWISDTSTKTSFVNSEGNLITGIYSNSFTYLDGDTWKKLSSTNRKKVLTHTLKNYSLTEENCKNNVNLYNLLTSKTYWLGTNCINTTEVSVAYYGILRVNQSAVSYCNFFTTTGVGNYCPHGICPVVSLMPDIVFDGNSTDGWTIK